MEVRPTGWKGVVIYILSGYHDLLILTEGVALPHLNRLIQQIQCGITRRPTYMLHNLDRPATHVKASVIAQPEQKPCKRLTIITACHLPELTSSVEHRY